MLEGIRPRGGVPVVVNHWATYCAPCLAELPVFAKVAGRHRGSVRFVGVSWDTPEPGETREEMLDRVERAAAAAGIRYESLVFEGKLDVLGERLQLPNLVLPQTYVLGGSGGVVASFDGVTSEEDLERAIARALGRS